MNSREKIIEAIRQGKPVGTDLPPLQFHREEQQDLLTRLSQTITSVGGSCKEVSGYECIDIYNKQKGENFTVGAVKELENYNINNYRRKDAQELEHVHSFFVKANIAIAENGAVWITEKDMGNVLLPFLCRQLVIVIEEKDIVGNMHQAYEKKIAIDEEGYGVFIAGPSKTADIEQALVVGAHGPLSLEVYIIKDKK